MDVVNLVIFVNYGILHSCLDSTYISSIIYLYIFFIKDAPCLEVLTVYENELHLINRPEALILLFYYKSHALNKASLGTIFSVFSMMHTHPIAFRT